MNRQSFMDYLMVRRCPSAIFIPQIHLQYHHPLKSKLKNITSCLLFEMAGCCITVFRNDNVTAVGLLCGSCRVWVPAASVLPPSAAQELAKEVFLGFYKREYFENVDSLNNFSIMTPYLFLGERGIQFFFKLRLSIFSLIKNMLKLTVCAPYCISYSSSKI